MNTVTLPAESVSGRTEVEKLANIALSSKFKAAISEQDLAAMLQGLGEVTSKVASGDTKDVESRNFENYRLRVLAHCGWDGVINRI